MRFIKAGVMAGLAAVFLAQGASAHERTWPARRLKSIWPEASKFTSKQVSLSASQIAHLEEDGIRVGVEDRSPTFYFAQKSVKKGKKPETLGIILFIDEKGENGLMEISVGMSAAGEVEKLEVWEHSEERAVAGKKFLSQFIGKTHSDSFSAGKGYQPIKDAPKASAAVARATQKALAIVDSVFGVKKKAGKHKAGSSHGESEHGSSEHGDEDSEVEHEGHDHSH